MVGSGDDKSVAAYKEWEDRTMERSLPATPGQDRVNSPDRSGFPSLADSNGLPSSLEALAESDVIRGLEERYGISEEGLF